METIDYLDKFQKCADQLDRKLFDQNKLEYKVGIWLNSVALKIQKKSWLNKAQAVKPFEESIFCSIWLNDKLVREGRLSYNIHALKLR